MKILNELYWELEDAKQIPNPDDSTRLALSDSTRSFVEQLQRGIKAVLDEYHLATCEPAKNDPIHGNNRVLPEDNSHIARESSAKSVVNAQTLSENYTRESREYPGVSV